MAGAPRPTTATWPTRAWPRSSSWPLALHRPLLLEGEAGVGKTEVAKVLARWTGGELLRLQCYEGIDAAQAVYEWDYARQLLHLRAAEARRRPRSAAGGRVCTRERFLVRRPLLAAIDRRPGGPPPVLLIDEVDRADDEFEAFLLEFLSDYAVTVPELGTFRADRAADRRDHLQPHPRRPRRPQAALPLPLGRAPDFDREVAIIALRAPGAVEPAGPPGGRGGRAVLRDSQPLQAARAWPRPSTGPRPSPPSGWTSSTSGTRGARPWGRCSSTGRMPNGCAPAA